MGTLDWMAAELRAAGLTVVEYPGWRGRHAPGGFAPCAVIWHHDASAAGPSPNMAKLIAEIGNGTTPPPLSQCWVDTAGRWHLTASGRANHAGIGSGWGRIRANNGNEDAIGIETDHTIGEAWPTAQLQSLRRGTAVLLRHLGARAADSLAGHKEYAPGRKSDPAGLDMAAERRAVAAINPTEDVMTPQQYAVLVETQKRVTNTYAVAVENQKRITAGNAAVAALSGLIAKGTNGLTAEAVAAAVEASVAKALKENTVNVDIDVNGT